MPVASPMASSPFSPQTDVSSPEPMAAKYKPNGNGNGMSHLGGQDPRLQAGMLGVNGHPGHFAPDFSQRPASSQNSHVFDYASISHRASDTPSLLSMAGASPSSHQGGTRSEPPRRQIEVEGLPVTTPSGQELAKAAR